MTAKDVENRSESSPQTVDALDHVDQASAQIYLTDEFRMYGFKVLQCSKRYRHDWATCPFAHPSENGKRRDPRTHTGIACSAMKSSSKCPRGDSCKFAHNAFEYWLHPSRYRTHLCTDGSNCKRKICFFAHSIQELREATQDCGILTPPAPARHTMMPSAGMVYRTPSEMADMSAALGSKAANGHSPLFAGHADAALLASLGLLAPPPPPPPPQTAALLRHQQLPTLTSTADELVSLLTALQLSRPHSPQDKMAAGAANGMAAAANAHLLASLLQAPHQDPQGPAAEALLQQLTANYLASQLGSPDQLVAASPYAAPALGGPNVPQQYGPAPGVLPWGEVRYNHLANDAGLLGGVRAATGSPMGMAPAGRVPQWGASPHAAQMAGGLSVPQQAFAGSASAAAAEMQYLMRLTNASSSGMETSTMGPMRLSLDASCPANGGGNYDAAPFLSGCLPSASPFTMASQDQWQLLEGLRNAQSFSGVRLVL